MLIREFSLKMALRPSSTRRSGGQILRSNIRIDLVVTDVGLPGGLNGRQVVDAARVTPSLGFYYYRVENAAGIAFWSPVWSSDEAVRHGNSGK
jgi:hypothetical protein